MKEKAMKWLSVILPCIVVSLQGTAQAQVNTYDMAVVTAISRANTGAPAAVPAFPPSVAPPVGPDVCAPPLDSAAACVAAMEAANGSVTAAEASVQDAHSAQYATAAGRAAAATNTYGQAAAASQASLLGTSELANVEQQLELGRREQIMTELRRYKGAALMGALATALVTGAAIGPIGGD